MNNSKSNRNNSTRVRIQKRLPVQNIRYRRDHPGKSRTGSYVKNRIKMNSPLANSDELLKPMTANGMGMYKRSVKVKVSTSNKSCFEYTTKCQTPVIAFRPKSKYLIFSIHDFR